MKQNDFFRNAVNQIPPEIKKQVDWSMDISDRIDSILKSKGLTPHQFAKLIGRSDAEISRWLGGTHNFTLATLAKISTILGKDLISI